MTDDLRLQAPAAQRNRDLIADVLAKALRPTGLILEIASGSGEHCLRFAERFPEAVLQPSDPSPRARGSIDAWAEVAAQTSGVTNIKIALDLDASKPDWPIQSADAMICINMIHISPWEATLGLFKGAAKYLTAGGTLVTYGPYMREGAHTSEGNRAFDLDLRAENPQWGIRSIEALDDVAKANGLAMTDVIDMPSNNFCLIFRKPERA